MSKFGAITNFLTFGSCTTMLMRRRMKSCFIDWTLAILMLEMTYIILFPTISYERVYISPVSKYLNNFPQNINIMSLMFSQNRFPKNLHASIYFPNILNIPYPPQDSIYYGILASRMGGSGHRERKRRKNFTYKGWKCCVCIRLG